MKKFLILICTSLFILVLAACGSTNEGKATDDENKDDQSDEVVVEHELGKTTVKKNPEKVVAFDFGSLDTLDKLGIDVAAVPQQNIPSYLEKYASDDYENVGGLKEPDFEKLSEVDPDLIIISGRQADLYDQLSELAPTIYLGVDTTDYMASFEKNAGVIGEIFTKEKDPDLLYVIDRGAVVDGESSAEVIVENKLMEKTKAYQNDNIIYLNPEYWYLSGGGLESVTKMIDEIDESL